MPVDIYARNPYDPTFEDYRNEINEGLDLFLQQIEMVLLTPKGSVLGEPEFGSSLDTYLWSFSPSESDINNQVKSLIDKYCTLSRKYSYDVQTRLIEGEVIDKAIIDISINGRTIFGLALS